MAIFRLGEHIPQVADTAWVANSAQVVGQVRLAEHASVWYGAVVRGDGAPISIGARSNVQDGSVLHVDVDTPLVVGEGVTVGHQVVLHGCTIGDGSLIGIQAVVLNRARIGRHSLVGAGALVTEGKTFPDGVLLMGRPAQVVRELTPEEIERVARSARHYVDNAARHRSDAVRIA